MSMTAKFVKMTLSERVQAKRWVTVGPGPDQFGGTRLQTQLRFSESIPANPYNRATRVGPPNPIVIERLIAGGEEREDVEDVDSSTRSSMRFSALSEERLLAAVQLAKKDLRRRRQESLTNSPRRPHQPKNSPPNKCTDELPQLLDTSDGRSKATGTKEEVTRSGARVLVYTPQKVSVPPRADYGQTPPTKDPGQGQSSSSQEPQLSLEIRRLQRELGIYIQRIEQLANRGGMSEEPLDPDEQRRMEVRRQEQAARSARIIYVLQQQVKEIQEDIEKLRSQKIRHTKKSRAMDRLAAAHRGAVRAMQVFTSQLSGPSEGRVPSHYKELGQLIRQLSLCSAKVEVGQGSAVPETALDILQKLETLDSALSKQESPPRRQARARSSSPARQRSPRRSKSPPRRAARAPSTRGLRGARGAAGPKKSLPGRTVRQPLRSSKPPPDPPLDRCQVLRAGLESLVQQRELREGGQKPGAHVRDAGFQQPTVASRLRVSQVPQRETSVPWIPASPHSPPQHRSPHRTRPEPRCLFSPLKPPSSPAPPAPPEQQQEAVGLPAGQGLNSDKKRQAQSEALRQAWLDRLTMQRLRELDRLSKEEAERIQRLRSNMGSPTQWAERSEQETRGGLKPPSHQAQQMEETWDRKSSSLSHHLSEQAADAAAESADRLSEALLEELLDEAARAARATEADRLAEGAAQRLLQAPTLESMLLRMEEMEKDQEAVRRRFATISYSDPYYWDREDPTGTQRSAVGSRPASPQPIRLTKPALRHTSTVDIILEEPVETGVLSETSLVEEGEEEEEEMGKGRRGEDAASSSPAAPGETRGGTRVSVSASMLSSVLRYKADYEAYLRLVAHEAVGSFNPWAISESLAEELMSEALADVAAEFQDVCEEYAEAVFTSEFLQPIQSPPASIPPPASQ